MKNYKSWIIIALFLMIMGCSESEEVAYNFTVDSYLRGMNIKGKPLYAPILLATTSDKTSSMVAVNSLGKKYSMESYWGYPNAYRWIPTEEDYTESFTEKETYTFTAIEDKTKKQFSTTATIEKENVPKAFSISDLKYDPQKQQIQITWENVGADFYVIKISKDLDASPMFQSMNLKPKDAQEKNLSVTIGLKSLKWFKTPTTNDVCTVSVHAFNLVRGNSKNIGGEFISFKKITWGKK